MSYEPVIAGNYTLSVVLRKSGGLIATYYRNRDLTGPQAGRYPFCLPANTICEDTQLDANIDFNWGTLPALPVPAYTYPADYFSVRLGALFFCFPPSALCLPSLRSGALGWVDA